MSTSSVELRASFSFSNNQASVGGGEQRVRHHHFGIPRVLGHRVLVDMDLDLSGGRSIPVFFSQEDGSLEEAEIIRNNTRGGIWLTRGTIASSPSTVFGTLKSVAPEKLGRGESLFLFEKFHLP